MPCSLSTRFVSSRASGKLPNELCAVMMNLCAFGRCPGLFQIRDSPWHSCATGSCAWQCRPRTSAIMDRRHSMLDDTKYGVATHCPGITGPIHQTAEGPVEAAKRRGEIREHLVEAAPVFPSWVASRLVGDHSHDNSPLTPLSSL